MDEPAHTDTAKGPEEPPRRGLDRGAIVWAIGMVVVTLAVVVSIYWSPQRPDPFANMPPVNACDLMRLEDADPDGSLALTQVRAPIEQSVGHVVAKCSYGTSELPIRLIGLEVRRFATAAAAEGVQESSETFVRRLAAADAKPVPGLGDRALWAGGRLGQLHVRAGAVRMIVTIEVGEEATRAERAEAIAARAIARLQTEPAIKGAPASAAPAEAAVPPATAAPAPSPAPVKPVS